MQVCRPLLLASALLLLCSCGPLSRPMFTRITPEAQANINTAWNNMLTPASRLDRQTLLAIITERQLFQAGITRGSLHAEKSIATGTVVMDITFDEPHPANDHLEIRIYDLAWSLVRSETFQREEVSAIEQQLAEMNLYLIPADTPPATQKRVPETSPTLVPTAEQLSEWTVRHESALKLRQTLDAATQPAASTRP